MTWQPIGLDELVRRAALMKRIDHKYLLPVADLAPVLDGLSGVRILDIDGRREFAYRSVYFDTPELDSYLAAARARRRRFKVRVRTYVDTGARYLEVKTRDGRGSTVKHRTPYAGDDERLDHDARAFALAVLRGAGICVDEGRFAPALTTLCRRTTLFLPAAGSRVTVDIGLAWALPGGTTVHLPDRAIVETKSERAASGVDRLLWSLKRRPCSVSKYGTGLAALRPELPANRWHPVLHRHFTTLTHGS